jgi:uncharacterized membrane protein
MDLLKWVGVTILAIIGVWIFGRLFWGSLFVSFFKAKERYTNKKEE